MAAPCRACIRSRSSRNNRGIESAQGLEIPKQIVEIAVAESVRAEDRHCRLRLVLHRLHLVLLVSLNPLARIHDLDREEVFVLLDALDRRPRRRRQRYRLVSRAEVFGAAPNPQQDSLARARDSDARQVGSQTSAGPIHPVTTGTVRAIDFFTVHGIAARRIGRGGRRQRAQVCENLPTLSVLDARVGRHLGPRNALFNRLEETRVGSARRPDLRDVGSADASRVHAVTVGTARAIETHAAADGVRIAFKRVLCRRALGSEKAAGHAQHRDREQRARPSHKYFLHAMPCLYNRQVNHARKNAGFSPRYLMSYTGDGLGNFEASIAAFGCTSVSSKFSFPSSQFTVHLKGILTPATSR